MSSKKALIECVRATAAAAAAAIANQITDEELCLPFNGDKKCKNGRTECIKSRKLTRKAMIECVKDIAKGIVPDDEDPPIWSP
ncbi:uncharacterized protein G6M90_00g070700 [Metarhizium brunneum]|uniref:Uncharacterized protein n=1 Tax=Metarhizium brunneum TaxID=500148 RepID=A0A7D5YVW4_9HYPO|nr:hypothetical protein G6M90_00g070700 [Metarhizium brunneum]